MRALLKRILSFRTTEARWNEAVERALTPKPTTITIYDHDGNITHQFGETHDQENH